MAWVFIIWPQDRNTYILHNMLSAMWNNFKRLNGNTSNVKGGYPWVMKLGYI